MVPYIIDSNRDRYPSVKPHAFHEVKVLTPYGNAMGSGWYKVNSTVTISISPNLIERDFFTNVIFEGWKINGNIVSTSSTYSFVINKPITIVASWRTGIKLLPMGLIVGLIVIVLAAILVKRRKRKPPSLFPPLLPQSNQGSRNKR